MPRGLIPEAFVQQSELVVWNEAMSAVYKHDNCAICHEAFNPAVPDICRVLDCHHVFHAKCVDLWFIKATFCPLCKSDLKSTFRTNSSQRSLGRSSHSSSQRSLGSRSLSSLRSGQILVGHSNSDPALLRVLQEGYSAAGLTIGLRSSPPLTPDRQPSGASLAISFSDRSLPVMGSSNHSRSERSLGILSSSSSGALPAVQEVSEELRAADDSQRSHSSNNTSPLPMSPVDSVQTARGSGASATAEACSTGATVHFATSPFLLEQSPANVPTSAMTSARQSANAASVPRITFATTGATRVAESGDLNNFAQHPVCARTGRRVEHRSPTATRTGAAAVETNGARKPEPRTGRSPDPLDSARGQRPVIPTPRVARSYAAPPSAPLATAPSANDRHRASSLPPGREPTQDQVLASARMLPPPPGREAIHDKLCASFRSAGTASSVASCASASAAGTPPTSAAIQASHPGRENVRNQGHGLALSPQSPSTICVNRGYPGPMMQHTFPPVSRLPPHQTHQAAQLPMVLSHASLRST